MRLVSTVSLLNGRSVRALFLTVHAPAPQSGSSYLGEFPHNANGFHGQRREREPLHSETVRVKSSTGTNVAL